MYRESHHGLEVAWQETQANQRTGGGGALPKDCFPALTPWPAVEFPPARKSLHGFPFSHAYFELLNFLTCAAQVKSILASYRSESSLMGITVFTRNDTVASINFTAVEGGDNSSYAGSEAREVFINTSSGNSGVNK